MGVYYKMITNKQKQQIKNLVKQGKKQREVAEIVGLSQATVGYWASEELRKSKIQKQIERFRKKPKKERSKIYKTRLEYQKKYQNYRYHNDEEFRRKQLERVKRR